MALIACPDCGQQVSDAAPACIRCGRPLAASAEEPEAPSCPACDSKHVAAGKRGANLRAGASVGFWVSPLLGVAVAAAGRNKLMLSCMTCGHQWQPSAPPAQVQGRDDYSDRMARLAPSPIATAKKGSRVGLLLGAFVLVLLLAILMVAALSTPSRERRSAATATQGVPLGPAPAAPVRVSVATFTAAHIVDKCDDYAISATAGVAAADQAWTNSFADGVIGDKKGMSRLATSCSQQFQTSAVLATCTVHITDHVDGDSGVELGRYEIDQVRQYFNPNTIKGRDARTTECPDIKGDWQAVDRNLDAALQLVKKAVLTVDGRRSSMDIEDCLAFLTQSPTGLKPSKGWSVSKGSGSKYVASYSFINGTLGENLATWEVDVSTKFVRYTNDNAKNLSWVPAE